MLGSMKSRLVTLVACVAAFSAFIVGQALAAVEYAKLAEPVESEVTGSLSTILPIIGTVFAIGFVVAWVLHRLRLAR